LDVIVLAPPKKPPSAVEIAHEISWRSFVVHFREMLKWNRDRKMGGFSVGDGTNNYQKL